MRLHWQKLLKELNHQPGGKIIDIGGGMDPVPVADMVVDAVDQGLGGRAYTFLDLASQKLPFEDNSFDIAICCQTLEDLTSPTLILQEISRVAKRGVIEVPHRGAESIPHKTANGLCWFGTGHHRWLIEEIDGQLVFVPKRADMLCRHPIPKWTGPGGIHMTWEHEIPAKVMMDIFDDQINANYRDFKERSREFWND